MPFSVFGATLRCRFGGGGEREVGLSVHVPPSRRTEGLLCLATVTPTLCSKFLVFQVSLL